MRHTYRYVKFASLFYKLSCKLILHDHFGSIALDKSIPLFMNNFLKPKFYIGVSNELVKWAKEVLKVSEIYLLENIIVKILNKPKKRYNCSCFEYCTYKKSIIFD